MPSTRPATMPTAGKQRLNETYIALTVANAQHDDIPEPLKVRGSRYRPLDKIPKIGAQQDLVTRDQARVILGGISYMTIARLDRSGKLTGIKLNDMTDANSEGPSTSKKLYHKAEVYSLAEELRKAALEKRRKAV
jgi:hypothetical protein